MATLEELVVRLEADNAKLVTALEESAKVTAKSSKQMEDAISKFAEAGSKETSKFSGVMQVFAGTILAQVATKAFSLVADAAGAFISKLGEGIQESAEFEKSMQQVANSLALSGKFSDSALQSLSAFANQMEEYAGIDDAVIAGNVAMLSSMTKLDSEGLQRAQKAAIDLSTALNIDLNTATKMVGKAANGETDSFKKLGITIAETGDKSTTLANTLNVLESRFGGAGGGAMKGFAGSMLAAQNALGNLFQAMGDIVTSNPVILSALQKVTQIMNDMQESIKGNASTLRKDLGDAFATLLQVIAAVGAAVEQFVQYTITGFKTIALGAQAVVDSFQRISDFISGEEGPSKAFDETSARWDDLVKNTQQGEGAVSKTLWSIADAASTTAATMDEAGTKVTASIKNQTNAVKELSWAEQQRLNQAKEFSMSLAEASVNVMNSYKMQADALQLVYDNETISFETYKAAKLASQLDMFAQEQAQLDQAYANKLITDQQYEAAKTQLQSQENLQRLKLQNDLAKQEKEINATRVENLKSTFGTIATLQNSSSKELQSIGKAAAIAQATMDGYAAVQKALASAPPPFNFGLAALVGAATAQNVAKIASVGLKSGIDSVPGVGTSDQFPAMLAPGERVVPANTNQDLIEFLSKNKDSGGGGPVINVNFNNGIIMGDKASLGAEIVEAINEAVARGMSLGMLKA